MAKKGDNFDERNIFDKFEQNQTTSSEIEEDGIMQIDKEDHSATKN